MEPLQKISLNWKIMFLETEGSLPPRRVMSKHTLFLDKRSLLQVSDWFPKHHNVSSNDLEQIQVSFLDTQANNK